MSGSAYGGDAGLVGLVGNPRPGSRTAHLAELVLRAVQDDVGARAAGRHDIAEGSVDAGADPAHDAITLIDLAALVEERGAPLGSGSQTRYADALERAAGAKFLVVATPVYKGSYTGLLKAFLDHVPAGAWRGVVAVPVITVGAPGHSLAADVHLRPLLLELGASTPTAALVVQEPQLAEPEQAIRTWLDGAGPVLARSLTTVPVPAPVAAPAAADPARTDILVASA